MKKPHSQGIVILFSILVVGLLLGIGVSLSQLAQKQLILSSIGRQSQIAFYAADTGAECARYWDIINNSFSGASVGTIVCGGDSSLPSTIRYTVNGNNILAKFQVSFASVATGIRPAYSYCADVTVKKDTSNGATSIESRGYNLPCVASYSTRKVERAVRLTY